MEVYHGYIIDLRLFEYQPFYDKLSLETPSARKKVGRPCKNRKRLPNQPPMGLG